MDGERYCESCGATLTGSPRQRFCSAACRTSAWKADHQYRDPRKAAGPSRNARQRGARKPDLRISYKKALDAMIHYPGAEAKLRALLTDRQRSALDKET